MISIGGKSLLGGKINGKTLLEVWLNNKKIWPDGLVDVEVGFDTTSTAAFSYHLNDGIDQYKGYSADVKYTFMTGETLGEYGVFSSDMYFKFNLSDITENSTQLALQGVNWSIINAEYQSNPYKPLNADINLNGGLCTFTLKPTEGLANYKLTSHVNTLSYDGVQGIIIEITSEPVVLACVFTNGRYTNNTDDAALHVTVNSQSLDTTNRSYTIIDSNSTATTASLEITVNKSDLRDINGVTAFTISNVDLVKTHMGDSNWGIGTGTPTTNVISDGLEGDGLLILIHKNNITGTGSMITKSGSYVIGFGAKSIPLNVTLKIDTSK